MNSVENHSRRSGNVLVCAQNLSTKLECVCPGGLHEARRIAERLEIHYTPKHGSWLNMAESELAVLAGQCLDRRIPGRDVLKHKTQAW